ncbi:lipase 3-like [Phlebotomus argentipes]|uniref:lipase 3-like n=1 Tax=Phlebotomus argentipes TaxID=94469 RepID=UPI002892A962|nr:lipase 3-like [Phlebotomus argentipes]
MIEWYEYPVESHVVQTADGYLLTMHRIPHGRAEGSGPAPGKPVAFLQHGLLGSSADWVVIGPERALAYLLADADYDVWLGNVRGNTYSRAHKTLDPDREPDREEFWNFSWHEIGVFDLPAMIDYTLGQTNQNKLSYVGHSQGTTTLFVMLSLCPEYNDVIKSAHALAPVAYCEHLKSPFIRAVAPFVDAIDLITILLGINEFAPSTQMMQMGGELVCRDESPVQEVCSNALFLIAGYDSEQLNRSQLSAIMHNSPAGAATRQLLHYAQLINSGQFCQFDHGPIGNMEKYGSTDPPNYPLSQITAPIALHYGANDWLAEVVDVEHLRDQLGSLIGTFRVPLDSFNHIDFQYAIDIIELVYDNLIILIKTYNN